jgi:hypothetical protein
MKKNALLFFSTFALALVFFSFRGGIPPKWQSRWVKLNSDGTLSYTPDEKGNIIPDFSNVGYLGGDAEIPVVEVVKTISPATDGSSEAIIQNAINEVAKRTPDRRGFRGAVLLKKGIYNVAGTIKINTSGIILRGEGNEKNGSRIVATGNVKRTLIDVSGSGRIKEIKGTRTAIAEAYVPVGAKSFRVASVGSLKAGDSVVIYRPGTEAWIKDLKMNTIVEKSGTVQWEPNAFNLSFERTITKIEGNVVFVDNPVVMAMETKYGGGEIYKYTHEGRIENVGIENLYLESAFESDTSENHGWDAIVLDKVRNGWVRKVTAQYFGYSCVNLHGGARNITVRDSYCIDPKSIITGGRRYSFNNNGQLNLFVDCHASHGRHDFVTGARIGGPNVYVNCTAKNSHGDIGPHHRWAMGTLYDNIITDGEINVRDRGNSGTGHGWAGVNQVLWNCKVKSAIVESPWVSGVNWAIGLQGEKTKNRLGERPDGLWEGLNQEDLEPASLYYAQLKAKRIKQ